MTGQRPRASLCLAVALGFLALAGVARAEEGESTRRGLPTHEHQPGAIHGEFTMGFLIGGRRYHDETFAYEGGAGDLEGVAGLSEPFDGEPFGGVLATGLRYDLRLVVSYVRMTVGVDFPFPSFEVGDTVGRYQIGGVEREVSVQSIRPYELRFGIGGEVPLGLVAPFLDLLGTVHFVTASLSIDGEEADYKASSFGFAIRGGVRVHLREWFFLAAAGEIGLVGDVFWGAELSVGFALG